MVNTDFGDVKSRKNINIQPKNQGIRRTGLFNLLHVIFSAFMWREPCKKISPQNTCNFPNLKFNFPSISRLVNYFLLYSSTSVGNSYL